MGGWGGGWARLRSAAIRRSGRCSRRRGSPAWPPGAAAPGPGSVVGGLGRTWVRDQSPRPLPGRIPSPPQASTAGGLRREPVESSSRVGARRGLQPRRGKGTRRSVFRLHSLKAFSSARRLSFFATFFWKGAPGQKAQGWAPQSPSLPQKTFFQSWLCSGGPSTPAGRGANSRPGRVGGAGACAPWLGARTAGTTALRARRARCALGLAGRQVDAVRVCLSLRLPCPLWASSAGCKLRLLRLSLCNEARGWVFFFFFPFCVCVCVCAQNLSRE